MPDDCLLEESVESRKKHWNWELSGAHIGFSVACTDYTTVYTLHCTTVPIYTLINDQHPDVFRLVNVFQSGSISLHRLYLRQGVSVMVCLEWDRLLVLSECASVRHGFWARKTLTKQQAILETQSGYTSRHFRQRSLACAISFTL